MASMDITASKLVIALSILVAVLMFPGCPPSSCDPLPGGIKTYSGSKGEEPQVQAPAPPVSQAPQQSNSTVERQITVTESNSVFSIGLPAGYREERSVTAQKPVDFWFEYLTPDMALEVNGSSVEVPVRRTAEKLGYTAHVYYFSYVLRNLSAQPLSYNLRIVPSTAGDSVPAVTREKWVAP